MDNTIEHTRTAERSERQGSILARGPGRLTRLRREAQAVVLTVSMALAGLLLARPASATDIKITNTAPPGSAGFQTVLNWAGWAGTVAGVIGLIITGVKFTLAHKRGDDGGEQMSSFGKVCAGLIILAMAGPVVNALS